MTIINPEIKPIIDKRIEEFKSNSNHFNELCFCLLTANYSAAGGIKIQKSIGDGFLTMSEEELAGKLKELGHRFPNARAKFIVEARNKKLVYDRDWLVENIKGLGMKEASHFLRNIGYTDYAIIDFHIVDWLVKHKFINEPKTLTKNKYLEIEDVLRKIAESNKINLAELDLYLWYQETGKILK